MDAYLRPVADGTPVYFFVAQVRPPKETTSTGWVNADVYPNNQGGYGSVLLQVVPGRVEAFLRIACMPPAEGCTPAVAVAAGDQPAADALEPVTPQPPQSPPACDARRRRRARRIRRCRRVAPECGGVTSPPCPRPDARGRTVPMAVRLRRASPNAIAGIDANADAGAGRCGRRDRRPPRRLARRLRHRAAHVPAPREPAYELNHDGVVDTYDVQIADRRNRKEVLIGLGYTSSARRMRWTNTRTASMRMRSPGWGASYAMSAERRACGLRMSAAW